MTGSYTNLSEIQKMYMLYITHVSSKGHAASLELADYMFEYLKENKPSSIVDMGSGFTSYICRYYQKHYDPSAYCVSVDDNDAWIGRTHVFLSHANVSTDNLILWEEFKDTKEKFDFILYDMGHIPTRIEHIEFPLSILADGGCILYDDIHFDKEYSNKVGIHLQPYLQDAFYKMVEKYDLNIEKLEDTVDDYGRYAVKVWR